METSSRKLSALSSGLARLVALARRVETILGGSRRGWPVGVGSDLASLRASCAFRLSPSDLTSPLLRRRSTSSLPCCQTPRYPPPYRTHPHTFTHPHTHGRLSVHRAVAEGAVLSRPGQSSRTSLPSDELSKPLNLPFHLPVSPTSSPSRTTRRRSTRSTSRSRCSLVRRAPASLPAELHELTSLPPFRPLPSAALAPLPQTPTSRPTPTATLTARPRASRACCGRASTRSAATRSRSSARSRRRLSSCRPSSRRQTTSRSGRCPRSCATART